MTASRRIEFSAPTRQKAELFLAAAFHSGRAQIDLAGAFLDALGTDLAGTQADLALPRYDTAQKAMIALNCLRKLFGGSAQVRGWIDSRQELIRESLAAAVDTAGPTPRTLH